MKRMERVAKFTPKVRDYWLLSGIIIFTLTVVGIPLLLLWIPVGRYFTGKYLDKLECRLTDRHLVVAKGIFFRMEKTIPLGKITDLALYQGPLMRYFGIHALSVETAGQSSQGSLVTLTGIEDAVGFRREVLAQRDRLERSYGESSVDEAAAESSYKGSSDVEGASLEVLREIRDSLVRIEERMQARND